MSKRYTRRAEVQMQSTRKARNTQRLRGIKRVGRGRKQTERFPTLPALLAYFAYLNAMKQQQHSPDVTVSRTLIIVVGLVLVVVALVAAGSPNAVGDVIKHWPIIP